MESENSPEEIELPALVERVQQRLLECKFQLPPKTDPNFISKFLRVRKYNVEAAVASIQRYYDNIFRNLRRFEGIKPSHFTPVYDSNAFVVLRSKFNGARAVFGNIRNWDTTKFSFRDFQLASIFVQEEVLSDAEVQLAGGILIMDMAGFGFSHARQCTVSEVKITVQTALQGIPMRLIGIHLINVPTLVWPIYKMASSLLPEKIRSRFHVHRSLDSLHGYLDKSSLPACLGGLLADEEAFDRELVRKLLETNGCYEDYWSGDVCHRPRRWSRKRSSVVLMHTASS